MPIQNVKLMPTSTISISQKVNFGHVILWRADGMFGSYTLNGVTIRGRSAHFYIPVAGTYSASCVFADGTATTSVTIAADARPVTQIAAGSSFPTLAANRIYKFARGGSWTTLSPITVPEGCLISDYGSGDKPVFVGSGLTASQAVFMTAAAGGGQLVNLSITSSGRGIAQTTPTAEAASNLFSGLTFPSIVSSAVNNENGASFALLSSQGSFGEYFAWIGNSAKKGNFVQVSNCTATIYRNDAAVIRGHIGSFCTIANNPSLNGNGGSGSAVRIMEGNYCSVTDNTLVGYMRYCENTVGYGAQYDPTLAVKNADFVGNDHNDGQFQIGNGADGITIDDNDFLATNPCRTWLMIDPQILSAGVVQSSGNAKNILIQNNRGTMPGDNTQYGGGGDFVQLGNAGSMAKVGYPVGIRILGNQYDARAATAVYSYMVRICGPRTIVTSCSGNHWTIKTGKPVGNIAGANVAAAAWPFTGDVITQV